MGTSRSYFVENDMLLFIARESGCGSNEAQFLTILNSILR